MKTRILITIILFFQGLIVSAQVTAGQIDNFEDATTQGWAEGGISPNPPTNISSGGPAGANDNYLRNDSSGIIGAGGKMVMFNISRWSGNYTAQSIIALRMHVRVTTNNLHLRVAMNGAGGGFGSKNAVTVNAGSGWTQIVLPIAASDLQSVSGNGALAGFDVAATLSSCTELRLLSNSVANWDGEIIAARLEVDNIEALTTLGLNEITSHDFKIAPNPVKTILELKTNNTDKISELVIFDILGKKVYTKEINNLIETIDVSHLKQGIYLLKVSNGNSSQTKKFIKN